ncbi:hypothetical protein C8Q78DRAFT_275779 [Trametes maxima]|nr:hypothetical protein C8Q78DRAFT_275779 [Trametes maxima]
MYHTYSVPLPVSLLPASLIVLFVHGAESATALENGPSDSAVLSPQQAGGRQAEPYVRECQVRLTADGACLGDVVVEYGGATQGLAELHMQLRNILAETFRGSNFPLHCGTRAKG